MNDIETSQRFTEESFVREFPKYVYHSVRGVDTIQWKWAALEMADQRNDLLAALEEMIVGISQGSIGVARIEAANAAIARARSL